MTKLPCRYRATASLCILLFCIACLFIIDGCSKTGQFEKQPAELPSSASTFFTVSSSVDPTVAAIAASLQRQDINGDIESKLSGHAGLPKWDKSIVAEEEIADPGNDQTGLKGSRTVLIPFVFKDAQQTNALLKVKVTATDTSYQLIYAGQYPEFGFDKALEGKWNAINIFQLFTKFDKAIFGHNKFVVKDKRILAGLGLDVKEMSVVELREDKDIAGKLVRVPVCNLYDVCTKPCSGFEASPIRPFNCCMEWGTGASCTFIWVETGIPASGGTALPLPGGSVTTIGGPVGSGGGSSIKDPCFISPFLSTPDHLCFVPDNGWEPVAPVEPLVINYPSFLSTVLNLSSAQSIWLTQNSSEAQSIFEGLEESLSDESPDGLSYSQNYPDYAIAASKMSIDAAMINYLEGPYDDKFWNTIKVHLPSPQQTVLIDPIFMLFFTTQCVILKAEHPEWGKLRLFFEAMKETAHLYLDAAGMVPGIGEFADLANGALYTIEGDGLNAKLSFAAAIPVAGWGATTAKWAKKMIVALNGSKRTLVWIKKGNNLISFGDRGLLRKVLGLAKGDKRFAHHIIPWEKGIHPAIQKAAQAPNAFHLNEIMNGIPLNEAVHSGNHTAAYLSKVQAALDAIPTNLNPQQTRTEVEKIINRIRTAIQNNPNTHIDNLVF